MSETGNFVAPILGHCLASPDKIAIVIPDPAGGAAERISYGALARDIAAWQAGFAHDDLRSGDRIVLLFRPDRRFYALLLATFAAGLVPVFIDAGMGFRTIVRAIEDAKPRAIVSTRKLLRLRPLLRCLKQSRCYSTDGPVRGATALETLYRDTPDRTPVVVPRTADHHALITFTSGSTGRPKGADRTHGLLIAQTRALDHERPLAPDERPVTALPIFLLHGLACGVTTILADCDLSKPGQVDPARLVRQLVEEKATMLVSATAFALRVADHMASAGIAVDSLQTVFIGGAPSTPDMVARYQAGFGVGRVSIGYGSTEAEPISLVTAEEILAAPRDAILVGTPVPEAEIIIAALSGAGPFTEADVLAARVADGTVGEILVKGPHVLKRYIDNPEANAETKIPCADGGVWHRTMDRGWRDGRGRLWLTGRNRDVVRVGGVSHDPFPLEIAAAACPGVRHAAIVAAASGDGAEWTVEAEPGADRRAIAQSLKALIPGAPLGDDAIRFVAAMPMDGRHNSKIDRVSLRAASVGRSVGPIPGSRWIVRLNRVDVLSLAGAALALAGAGGALAGHFAVALAFLSAAMLADALDGYYARKLDTLRPFGRYLDGFVDTIDYLLVPALFLFLWGFSGPLDTAILLALIGAGIIRLAVFNEVGNRPRATGRPGYVGMPVFWTIFILWGAYLAAQVVDKVWVFWALDAVLLGSAVAMLRNAMFFKFTKFAHLVLIPSAGLITFAVLGLEEAMAGAGVSLVTNVLAALVLMLPCVVGMSLHMLVVARNWLPALLIPVNARLFGANKTLRGFIVGPPLCILGAVPAAFLAERLDPLDHLDAGPVGIITLGLVMGFAYLVFELPNSFLKRRAGIPPGGKPRHHAWIFTLLDQIDSGIGQAVFAYLFLGAPGPVALLLAVLFPAVALAVKRGLFALRWKSSPV